MNSRMKGARIERKAAAYLTALGFPAERAARCGVAGGEDIICRGLRIHLECKGDRSIDIGTKALEDAAWQARETATQQTLAGLVYVPWSVLWWRHRKGWALSYPEAWGTATIAGDAAIKAYLVRFSTGAPQ